MAANKLTSLSNEAKQRFGILCGIISALLFMGALAGFISDAKILEDFDLGINAGVGGWYAMVLSLLLATVALILGIMMKSE